MFSDLRSFIEQLEAGGDICRVEARVQSRLELAEIHRRVIAAGGPALLFENVEGSPFRVVTNLFGTEKRVRTAFGDQAREFVAEAARLPEELMPPDLGKVWGKRRFFRRVARVGMKARRTGPVLDHCDESPDLTQLPALTSWSEDGGPFLTLPLVHTQDPVSGVDNLGMYRIQIFDETTTGLHFQIGKGGGYHYSVAEGRNESLPVSIFLGGPPALIVAAIAPLPENVPEFLLASLLMQEKLPMVQPRGSSLAIPAGAEFALIGEAAPHDRRLEGPFGDHYGYYSLKHDFPVFNCRRLYRRRDAILPATVVGKPRQEDFFIGDYLQDLLSPLFSVVMPGVKDLWSYGETGYHSLAAAVVRERYKREAMTSAFRILGEGQLALTKFLLVTDHNVDLRDFRATLECVLERTDLRCDLFVFPNLSMDTLDYAGPRLNEGSKGVLLGIGEPRRELPREFEGYVPNGISQVKVFCGGCLVVSGHAFSDDANLAQRVAEEDSLEQWPLIVLVDDAEVATRSAVNFLWTTFTRFDPASDLHWRSVHVFGNQALTDPPVVIDARKKPLYPDELFCDDETHSLVDRRWQEYFPNGMEMGDSGAGHLD
jgi:UbiD family decarboxylase